MLSAKTTTTLVAAAFATSALALPGLSEAGGIGSVKHQRWTALWWQWALSLPNVPTEAGVSSVHPLSGDDASVGDPHAFEYCGVGQTGNLWFLGGDFTGDGSLFERTCTIPPGKNVVLAVINAECSTAEGDADPDDPAWRQARDLASCVKGLGDLLGGSAQLIKDDGSIRDLPVQRVATANAFPVVFPPQTINGLTSPEPNPSLVQADGQWVFVAAKDLRPGNYRLEFEGTFDDPSTPEVDFVLNGAYNLKVAWRSGRVPH
ncbi:MAG: hypothetical protein K9L70_09040 [Thiohalocapsa sp.]|nr:hypothetical protein [Thiohalocapsa sp.]MCF7992388.1 hypothetical protein [Thiohalocapsa sp.]